MFIMMHVYDNGRCACIWGRVCASEDVSVRMVPGVGLEPTRLAAGDFESGNTLRASPSVPCVLRGLLQELLKLSGRHCSNPCDRNQPAPAQNCFANSRG